MSRPIQLVVGLMVLVAVSTANSSRAQERVLVLPWSVAGARVDTVDRASEIRAALGSPLAPISADQARASFLERGSADPPTVSDSEVDAWLALSRDAVRSLAHADYPAARAALEQAQALSDRAAAELNREEARARQVLDTCLFGVRAYVETSDPGAADATMECRRLVPRIAPTPHIHTPEVVELLGRVDRRLADGQPGTLTIESTPSDCVVRVNGVVLGRSPLTSTDLAAGDYRVQVECGDHGRGRIHRLHLGSTATSLAVDARFDSVIRTADGLRLEYADQVAADTNRVADAAAVARFVGATEVWLVSTRVIERVRVDTSRVVASANAEVAAVTTADIVDALVHERNLGPTVDGAAQVTVAQGPRPSVSAETGGHDEVGPWVLLGTGLATAVAGGVLIGLGVPDYNATSAPVPSELTYAQALARQQNGELFVNVGAVLAGVGCAVALGGVIWAALPAGATGPEVALRIRPWGIALDGRF